MQRMHEMAARVRILPEERQAAQPVQGVCKSLQLQAGGTDRPGRHRTRKDHTYSAERVGRYHAGGVRPARHIWGPRFPPARCAGSYGTGRCPWKLCELHGLVAIPQKPAAFGHAAESRGKTSHIPRGYMPAYGRLMCKCGCCVPRQTVMESPVRILHDDCIATHRKPDALGIAQLFHGGRWDVDVFGTGPRVGHHPHGKIGSPAARFGMALA